MNTRFNQTVNGPLHVGHLYLILLNYYTAKDNGGRFIVRFDDDQLYWSSRFTGVEILAFVDGMKEDIEWAGIVPDLYTSEHEERAANEDFIQQYLCRPKDIMADGPINAPRYSPTIKTIERPYPYTTYLTGTRVAQDYREGIDLLIRGEDLITDFSLYCHFCDVAGIRRPTFQYVSRMYSVISPYGQALADLSEVSKTQGGYSIRAYQEKGWNPNDLLSMLAESALEDPWLGWTYENVKRQPILRSVP